MSVSLAETWRGRQERDWLEGGVRQAAGQLRLRDYLPEPRVEYRLDPIGFCTQQLGVRRETLVWSENPGYDEHRWDGTPDPIATWFGAIAAGKDVAVESCTASGKSFGLALTKLWFLACWRGARAFDFADTLDRLDQFSWTEQRKLWPRFKALFPSARTSSLRLRMDGEVREGELAGWGAVGLGYQVGAEEEVAAGGMGMHAEHMLVSVEEAPKVELALTRAIENTTTAPHNMRQMVGNPDSQDDPLHRFATEQGVVAVRISAYDHPNVVVNVARDPDWRDVQHDVMVVPGATSRAWILRQRARYEPTHWLFMSRVRGLSPPQHAKSLIRQEWLDRAAERWHERRYRFGLQALGVDVARSVDGDKGAIADGVGAHLDEVVSFPCPDPVQLGVRLAAMMATRAILEWHVGIDVGGGYGGGTVDKLKELELYVRAINPGSRPVAEIDETLFDEAGKAVREVVWFRNRRAQDYWHLMIDLQMDRVALPPDPELHEELRAVRWQTKLGKIVLEEKQLVTERLGRSPDKADAVVNWNAVRERLHPVEQELSPWDPKVLKHAALESRRIKDRPPTRPENVDPLILEHVR